MNFKWDIKSSGWIWQVTLLCLVLGMLLAAALKTQQNIKIESGIPTTQASGLVKAFLSEKENNRKLQEQVKDLLVKVDESQKALGQGTGQTQVLSDELQKAKFLAGLVPAVGPGVEVILQDSKKKIPGDADPEFAQEYIIHDLDLRNFVNELLSNGAEAISINDQRVIAKTSIRCVGATIRVNDVSMAPPFVITAIGPPNVLESALKMRDGIISQFRFIQGLSDSMVQVKKQKNLTVPAYSGNALFKYAHTEDSEAAEE